MYIPAIVMVSFYFEERRALATGDTLLTDNYSMILMYLRLLVDNLLNPFDTKPMAKIAVKMSIMRVVKFMSN